MVTTTSKQLKLSESEIARRLWRIYELALVAAERAEQQQHQASPDQSEQKPKKEALLTQQ